MKRLYPWLIGAGLLGASCSLNNDVKPGAPVLTFMSIFESTGVTDISGGEPACPTTAQDGASCDPMNDGLCQSVHSWCRCLAGQTSQATWSCSFEPTSTVLASFDRLLDTEPLDYDPMIAAGRTDVASIASTPGKMPGAITDYASNGSETALIFKLVTPCPMPCNIFHGPHLIISGSPTLPSGSSITVTLDKTKVRAKDHTSLFVGSGVIKDGVLTFATAPFAAAITVPVAPPPDGGATDAADAESDGGVADASDDADAAVSDGGGDDAAGEAGTDAAATETAPPPLPEPVMAGMQVVTIAFNNLTDQAQIGPQITVTVNGAPFTDVVVAATDAMKPDVPAKAYAVSPLMNASWPAGAVITITVGAAAADLQGVTLGAPASATFVTEP